MYLDFKGALLLLVAQLICFPLLSFLFLITSPYFRSTFPYFPSTFCFPCFPFPLLCTYFSLHYPYFLFPLLVCCTLLYLMPLSLVSQVYLLYSTLLWLVLCYCTLLWPAPLVLTLHWFSKVWCLLCFRQGLVTLVYLSESACDAVSNWWL